VHARAQSDELEDTIVPIMDMINHRFDGVFVRCDCVCVGALVAAVRTRHRAHHSAQRLLLERKRQLDTVVRWEGGGGDAMCAR
jgi:hypothetical protein